MYLHHALASLDAVFFLSHAITLVAIVWLMRCVTWGAAGRASSRVMRLRGDVSNPLYLAHTSTFVLVIRLTGVHDPWLTAFVFYVCLDCGGSDQGGSHVGGAGLSAGRTFHCANSARTLDSLSQPFRGPAGRGPASERACEPQSAPSAQIPAKVCFSSSFRD